MIGDSKHDQNGENINKLILIQDKQALSDEESLNPSKQNLDSFDGNVPYFEKKHNLKTTKKTFESSLNLYGDKKSGQ